MLSEKFLKAVEANKDKAVSMEIEEEEELRMSKERELTYREALKEIKSVSSKTDKKEERLKMINKISITALEIFEEQA